MYVSVVGRDETELGRVTLEDGAAVLGPGTEFLGQMKVFEPATRKVLTLEDGERYLRALPAQFRNPYTRAYVREGEPPEPPADAA